jgi:hypothetical protein
LGISGIADGRIAMSQAGVLRVRFGRDPVSAYVDTRWQIADLPGGAVPFHRIGRTAISVGSPLGPAASSAQASAGFVAECRRRGWRPVLFQAPVPVEGLRSHLVAREAYVDVDSFTLAGPRMANLRHSESRARRDCVSVAWMPRSQCSPAVVEQMRMVSEQWTGGRRQLGLTYGRFDDTPMDALVGLAWSESGRLEAFTTWRPLPAGRGLVLDLIRRRSQASPGSVELLVVEAIGQARQLGLGWLSLGAICERPARRWLRLAMRSTERYGHDSLRKFKEKFAPRWENRYLCLPRGPAGVLALAALGLAHVRAPWRGEAAPLRPAPPAWRRRALRWGAVAGLSASLLSGGIAAGAADSTANTPLAAYQPVLNLMGIHHNHHTRAGHDGRRRRVEDLKPGRTAQRPSRSGPATSPSSPAIRRPTPGSGSGSASGRGRASHPTRSSSHSGNRPGAPGPPRRS